MSATRTTPVLMNHFFPIGTVLISVCLLAASCWQGGTHVPIPSPSGALPQPPPAVSTMLTTTDAIEVYSESDIVPNETRSDSSRPASDVGTDQPSESLNGQELGYVVRQGDTLASIARRFNTQQAVLMDANPGLDLQFAFLAPGTIVHVHGYDLSAEPLPYLIIPDSETVYGPAHVDFDLQAVVGEHEGWLANVSGWDGESAIAPGWRVVEAAALNFSVSPRLLLALLEYQSGLLTDTSQQPEDEHNPYGIDDWQYDGLGNQLIWVAERLNAGYYGWRSGQLTELRLADGLSWPLNRRLNAGTVAVYNFFAPLYATAEIEHIGGPEGFASTYRELFGDPFTYEESIITHDLQQPQLDFPFEPGVVWNFTGGPHNAWRDSPPWGAIDFAPKLAFTGCQETNDWVTAMAPGVITRIQDGVVALNLDTDGHEETGWTVVYVHLRSDPRRIKQGQHVDAGYRLGHASCDGGLRATSSHVHLTRKYNGEWIEAGTQLPFEMGGWVVEKDHRPYEGNLLHKESGEEVTACSCAREDNQIVVSDQDRTYGK